MTLGESDSQLRYLLRAQPPFLMNTESNTAPDDLILVLNCGSSSIKFALFETAKLHVSRAPAWKGQIREIMSAAQVLEEDSHAAVLLPAGGTQPYHSALERIRERVSMQLAGRRLRAVAHRVVHGGGRYSAPVRIDAVVLRDLRGLIPLAPLHQPFALEAIEILLDLSDLPQIACFDTGFHEDLPPEEQMLPLPWVAWQRGVRRYGFHGLSYEYLASVLPERHGSHAWSRVIAAHLGNGASLCAIRDLRSVGTTMGFSALDGLMMGTRCGTLDPGAVIYLMEVEKWSLERVSHALYHESGLLGISGISADPRVLLQHEHRDDEVGERVRAALKLYVRRLLREIGALVAVLGGVDLLVFTAGIGEHNTEIRRRICAELAWLGVRLDEPANIASQPIISTPNSRVTVAVEPTNEEWIAARHAAALLST